MDEKKLQQEIDQTILDIPILDYLTKLDRPRAKELERDSKGRVIVDITRPHILEDIDYFREAALHFQKHDCYTFLYPNPQESSDYMKFWKEEMRRCTEGYVRPSDGEWVSGYFYWYLNYCTILVNVEIESHEDSNLKRAERKREFPHFWDSDYLYFHYIEQAEQRGLHCSVLKTRGRGYSFKGAAVLSRNFFMISESKSYAIASEDSYLRGDAILDKTWDIMDFVDEHTPWKKAREEKDTSHHRKASYKDPNTKIVKGYKSEIIGITLKNQPERARGKRGKIIMFEESGKFPNLLTAWAIARPSMEDGNYTFGTMVAFGTGGTEGADFDGIRTLFEQPEGYRVYGIKNVFDRGDKTTSNCGWYCGEYFNRKGYYDENGNSDVIGALKELLIERDKVRRNTTDPNAMIQEKADRSITPEEAVMKREGSIFPVEDLKVQKSEILTKPARFDDALFRVELINKEGRIETRLAEHPPVKQFPIRENYGLVGCVEIREHPINHGIDVPYGIYIAGVDPYDDDMSTTNSLGSCVIMNRLTGRIVAEYTGRPATAEKFYEVVYRMLKYYNARCNYENNKKGMFSYFDKKNALYLLTDTPQILKDMQIVKGATFGNTAKGTHTTKEVNNWRNSLIKSWLLSDYYGEGGEDKMTLHHLWNIAMVQELIDFRPDEGNYDRISALGMVLILREDMHRVRVEREAKTYPKFFDSRPSVRGNRYLRKEKSEKKPFIPLHLRNK